MYENSRSIPLPTITIYVLWTLVGLAHAAAWVFMLLGHLPVAYMLGFSSCVCTGIAVLMCIRSYAARNRALMRALNTAQGAVPIAIHSLS